MQLGGEVEAPATVSAIPRDAGHRAENLVIFSCFENTLEFEQFRVIVDRLGPHTCPFHRLYSARNLLHAFIRSKPQILDECHEIDPVLLPGFNPAAGRGMSKTLLSARELLRRQRKKFLHTSILAASLIVRFQSQTTAHPGRFPTVALPKPLALIPMARSLLGFPQR